MDKFTLRLTQLVIFLLPLCFLPVTRDLFDFNKNFLLMFFALSLAAIFVLKIAIRSGRAKTDVSLLSQYRLSAEEAGNIVISPLTLPILAIAAAYLLSLLLFSPNKIEALLQPAGAGTIFALTIIYFLLKQNKSLISQYRLPAGEAGNIVISPLLVSALLLSLISIVFTALDSFGFKTLSLGNYQIATAGFTPAGSSLSLASFLAVVLVIFLSSPKGDRPSQKPFLQKDNPLSEAYKEVSFKESHRTQNAAWDAAVTSNGTMRSPVSKYLNISISTIIFLGLLTTLYSLFQPGQRPALLPLSAGWTIAVESFKNPKNLLFGVGPGNFLNVFTQARPLELNAGNLWPFRFGTSSNFYLQVLTEVGILGLAALVWLLWRLNLKEVQPLKIPLLVIFLLLALIPANILLLFVLYLSLAEAEATGGAGGRDPAGADLAALGREHQREGNPRQDPSPIPHNREQAPVLALSAALLLLIAFSFYLLGRAYAAEVSIFQGLRAAGQNRPQETYDRERQALILNPRNSSYRMIFAQTNLALANSLAAKEEVTDADRQTISQLVNQAIVNAKLAVQLTPSVITWENLASIYSALINVAAGADQWAVSSYNQAISLDPTNPALRVAFGGLYYSLGQLVSKAQPQGALGFYETASRQFEIAVNLKPDLPNPWYNLANAQREAGRVEQARFSYQQTLALLDPQANDYQRVQEELEALPKPPATPASAQTLETLSPPASPSAELEPPLELPEEAGPEISPTITPALSPTPTESPEGSEEEPSPSPYSTPTF